MDSARPSIVRKVVPVGIAFVVGFMLANPAGFGSRVAYWMPGTNKVSALKRLMEAEPAGGATELNHAIESDDKDLRLSGARYIALKGDPRGLEIIVEMCPPSGPLTHPARAVLEELIVRPVLRFKTGSCWSGQPRS